MGTVTIAATYGAGGSMIGPAVAKRLKLPFVDRAIPVSLAEKIHEPLVAALTDDSESGSAVGRLLNSALNFSGLFVGIPVGIFVGRVGWHLIANRVPLRYVQPLAIVATIVVIPVALVLVNVLALAPGRRAARLQPAQVLHAE